MQTQATKKRHHNSIIKISVQERLSKVTSVGAVDVQTRRLCHSSSHELLAYLWTTRLARLVNIMVDGAWGSEYPGVVDNDTIGAFAGAGDVQDSPLSLASPARMASLRN